MKYILIQSNDFKIKEIGKKLEGKGVKLIPINSSPIILPFYIILYLLKYGKPSGIIYRYLNDYPSVVKSAIRTLSEVFGVIIALILNFKIIWICHNIDRESHMHYPFLTKFRRWIFKRFSKKILVTDPLLIKYAKKQFPKQKTKIDYITFGSYPSRNKGDKTQKTVEIIKEFVVYHNNRSDNNLFGFVAGNINWKTSQFSAIPKLIYESGRTKHNLRFIVIGPIGSYLKKYNYELYIKLNSDSNILFLDGYHELNLDQISNYIDFYWRVYLDLSIPATIYESAYYKKPMVTQNIGFLGEAVSAYSLGFIIDSDYTNLSDVLKGISKWNPVGAENFLKTHTWEKTANKFHDIISK